MKPKSEQDVKVWLITKQKYTNLVDGPEAFSVYVIDKSRYDEALAEIERLKKGATFEVTNEYIKNVGLQAENQKLREALKQILKKGSHAVGRNEAADMAIEFQQIARAALEGKP